MTREDFLTAYCTPVTGQMPIPGGTVQVYQCPPPLLPFLPPHPEDVDIPDIDIPGISQPGGVDEPNITDDPEEGQIVGPVIPPAETETDVADPEPGSLAGELGEPMPVTDLPSPHSDIQEEVRTRASEDECVEGCNACPPHADGNYDWNTYISAGVDETNSERFTWARYQEYVCKLPNDGPNGRIVEFYYLTYTSPTGPRPYPWDGFEPATCTLVEAKYGYDTHLTSYNQEVIGSDGEPDTRRRTIADPDRPFLAEVEFAQLVRKANEQAARIAGVDDVGLIWAFSSFDSQDYFYWNGGGDVGNPPRFDSFHLPWSGG